MFGLTLTSQPSQPTPTTIAKSTAAVPTRASDPKKASVPLETPVMANPTTGKIGTPQPTTLHALVENPSTLVRAPAMPPCRPALIPHP